MNKKYVAIAAITVIGSTSLAGCSTGSEGDGTGTRAGSYHYRVSGVVEAAQVDQECGEDLALDLVAYGTGKGGGGKSKGEGSGSSQSGASLAELGQGKTSAPSAKKTKTPPVTPEKNRTGSNGPGVKLTKKPDAPERVFKVPSVKTPKKTRGCKTEYELFVRNSTGLFEQDVREVDWRKCSDRPRERFPLCTGN